MTHQAGKLCIEGRLSFATVDALLNQSLPLLKKKGGIDTIDLSKVSYVDSAGLALLCEWKRRLKQVSFYHIPQQIAGMITLSGLSTILFESHSPPG